MKASKEEFRILLQEAIDTRKEEQQYSAHTTKSRSKNKNKSKEKVFTPKDKLTEARNYDYEKSYKRRKKQI